MFKILLLQNYFLNLNKYFCSFPIQSYGLVIILHMIEYENIFSVLSLLFIFPEFLKNIIKLIPIFHIIRLLKHFAAVSFCSQSPRPLIDEWFRIITGTMKWVLQNEKNSNSNEKVPNGMGWEKTIYNGVIQRDKNY